MLSEQSLIGTSSLLLLLSRRIQLPSKLSWPDVRLFACHNPPPPLAWYSARRFADYCAWQDKMWVNVTVTTCPHAFIQSTFASSYSLSPILPSAACYWRRHCRPFLQLYCCTAWEWRVECYSQNSHIRSILVTRHVDVGQRLFTLRASEAAAQCIVIGPVCGFVCLWVCLFVCLFVGLLPR